MGLLDRLNREKHVQPGDTVAQIRKKQMDAKLEEGGWTREDQRAAMQANLSVENKSTELPTPRIVALRRKQMDVKQVLSGDERRELADWNLTHTT